MEREDTNYMARGTKKKKKGNVSTEFIPISLVRKRVISYRGKVCVQSQKQVAG